MDQLGVDDFHIVAAKIGGDIARPFAARRPDRVNTLRVIGTPAPVRIDVKEKVLDYRAILACRPSMHVVGVKENSFEGTITHQSII